nr:hypothetical protein [uncultured Albidiferax sp.]
MRDLGTMGESTFSLWCAEVGLVHNGSKIDKTGWDFYVEFPFTGQSSADELHSAAIECKVQVKATDKRERKLPIKLSNLRRLITAQMPAFFVFIEFDGENTAQRIFLRHIDKKIISKTLKKIHEIEQLEGRTDHHKRTMTIDYGNEHEISPITGQGLKAAIESLVGNNMASYVSAKKKFLESTGFESGFAQLTATTEGEENLHQLIDVSIGARKSVTIKSFKGYHTRFGVKRKSPMIDSAGGTLEMPNLKPAATGLIHFRQDPLAPSLTFTCKLFISPLNLILPKELGKMRVEGDFFDIKLNPHTGAAEYKFDGLSGIFLTLNKLRDTLRLLRLITSSSKKATAELVFGDFPPFEFSMNCLNQPFELSKELEALDCAIKILAIFDTTAPITTTLNEISKYSEKICQFHSVLEAKNHQFKVEFGVTGDGFDSTKMVACIVVATTRIGNYVFGAILAITGNVHSIDNDLYCLLASNVSLERKIISNEKGVIQKSDLISAIEHIEKKYELTHEVVTMLDKTGEN